MTADEMFEELGYAKNEEPLELGKEKIPYICYTDNYHYKSVHFNLDKKFFTVSCMNENYAKILQAINKKVEELGW